MVAISKILTGALLVSSTIGNTSGTHLNTFKVDYGFSSNLERNLETIGGLNYFEKIQSQRLTELKPPITYGCVEDCTQLYNAATAACLLIPEPISQASCHALAAAAYALCLTNC